MFFYEHRRRQYFAVAAMTLLSIVCLQMPPGSAAAAAAAATATTAASTIPTRATEVHVGHAHKNMAAYKMGYAANRHYPTPAAPATQATAGDSSSSYYRQEHYDRASTSHRSDPLAVASTRRSYHDNGNGMTEALLTLTASSAPTPSSASGEAQSASPTASTTIDLGRRGSSYNGLTNLGGWQHISSNGYSYGYGSRAEAAAASSAAPTLTAKQQIPIYEEQHEQDAGAHTAPGYGGENNQHTANAFISPAYHNNFMPSPYARSQWGDYQQQQQHGRHFAPQSNDKISDGNFQHHYEHNSGYNGLGGEYSSPSAASAWPYTSAASSYAPDALDEAVGQSFGNDPYSSHAASGVDADDGIVNEEEYSQHGGGGHGGGEVQHQTNVINYIPYPVVKKQAVPVRTPVRIPISHAVIVPVSKPVPIQIPVTQQVQVPVEKELKIPIERVVPYPVEKHIPVPVEKRVPYQVVRYEPVKVSRPYPVKVPVYKTILHKVKGGGGGGSSWW